MADEIFYLIQETSTRAMVRSISFPLDLTLQTTLNVHAVCTFINTADEILNAEVKPFFASRSSPASYDEEEHQPLTLALTLAPVLNGFESCTKYTLSLKQDSSPQPLLPLLTVNS